MTKPFAWSWSKLKNYRSCPKRHYEIDIAKTVKEEESDALRWGNQLHDAMAKNIGSGLPLPEEMRRYSWWPTAITRLKQAGLDVKVERKLAIAADYGATAFFAADAWCRSVIDVSVIPAAPADWALTFDWKTGNKVNPEFEQLGISAQIMFAHHPQLQRVASFYIWIGHDTHTLKIYRRDEMTALWAGLMPEIKQMQFAHDTLTYPPKPSGLCRNYCPVVSCPHHGKGSY